MSGSPDRYAEVHFVVPAGIDDPRRPSGGNVYDRRLADELPARGWAVREHRVPGTWPNPTPSDRHDFDTVIDGLADESVVLVDGLVASTADSLVRAARRLRVVVLLHMPLAETSSDESVEQVEAAVLNAAATVITPSAWAREWVITHLGVAADRVWAAVPGVDPASAAHQTASGENLLCTAPVTAAKGHDVLVAALAQLADLEWRCTCAGALDLDPGFVESVIAAAERAGIADRLVFTGPLTRPSLDDLRSRTDLVVSPSRRESYGMAVTEGLACGIPVIATDVGGHREATGAAINGTPPGALVPADDANALADAVRSWLTDPGLRARWRTAAHARRANLTGWTETARSVAAVLEQVSANGTPPQPGSENMGHWTAGGGHYQ